MIALIFGTGILGGTLLTVEGHGVIRKAKMEIGQARIPKNQIIDGVLIILGAILLITPGLISDAFGIILLFPLTRVPVRKVVKGWIQRYIFLNL